MGLLICWQIYAGTALGPTDREVFQAHAFGYKTSLSYHGRIACCQQHFSAKSW